MALYLVTAYVASEAYDKASDGVMDAVQSVENAKSSVSDAMQSARNRLFERDRSKCQKLAEAVRAKYERRRRNAPANGVSA